MKRDKSDHTNILATEEATQVPEYWVFKLVNDVFGDSDAWKTVYIPGVFTVLKTLEEYEQHIVGMRYIRGMTYEEIGKEYCGYTKERIRQILAKAMRKLRHPSRSKYMRGIAHDTYSKVEKRICELQAEYLAIKHPELVLTRISIEDLDLSVRTYNCIKRGGYSTVADFLGKSVTDLMRVRNLGMKSLDEIVNRLAKLNIKPDENNDNFQLRDDQGNVIM